MHESNLFFQHHAVPVPMFLRGCLRGCETPARRFAARPPFRRDSFFHAAIFGDIFFVLLFP